MTDTYDPTTTSTESEANSDKKTTELSPDDLLVRIREWWRIDYPAANRWHKEARLDFDFRAGEQWPKEEKEYMEDAQKRACLCFNQIDPVIDVVTGSEITNRQEVRYVPRQIGDAPVNEVLTEAARWFRDECDAEHEESAAFADAATCGMGWTETRLDYEENPDGEPKITRVDPLEMVWDIAAKQANLVDARRIFRVQRKVPLIDAKNRWQKDASGQEISEDADYDATWATDLSDSESPYVVHYPGEPLTHETSEGKEEKEVTLVQVQWFERETFYRAVITDATTGQPQVTELSEDEHAQAGARAALLGLGYKAVRQIRKIYYQAFIGGVVLEVTKMAGPSGALLKSFSIVPITGKWDRNNQQFYGLVRSMRGPQMWANKWLSTSVEIMARNAKGGLMLEEGSVVDPQEFEEDWAKPGANSYFKPGAITGGKVQPKPASQFPNDFMQMTQFAISSIRQVTGINPELLGMAGTGPSKEANTASQEYQRRQSATVILAPLFDALRRYRRVQGRVLLYLITEYLSDGRLVRIVGQENDQYVPLIHNPGTLEYDVIVDDAASSPNQKELVWNSMVQMLPMIQGMQPPPQVILALLDYSPLPASVVSKVKAAMAQAQANAPPPQPDPMTLIMQEKQADIQATQQKRQIDYNMKQQENALDVAHLQAKAQIDLQSRIANEHVRLWAKHHESRMETMGEAPPDPMRDGIIAGIQAGAQRFATELMAGKLAEQAGMPVGNPTHISNIGPVFADASTGKPQPTVTGVNGGNDNAIQ